MADNVNPNGVLIQAFSRDGTLSPGAQAALEKWCEQCVGERIAEVLQNGHFVQWSGPAPQPGATLVYDPSVGWVASSLSHLGPDVGYLWVIDNGDHTGTVGGTSVIESHGVVSITGPHVVDNGGIATISA